MEKTLRSKLKRALYGYNERKERGARLIIEWADSNMGTDYGKVSVQSSKTNAKENKLCALMDEQMKDYRWCVAVEKVLDYYKFDIRSKLIRFRYFERKSEEQTCFNIGISRRTFFYWNEEILLKLQQWAEELGVL